MPQLHSVNKETHSHLRAALKAIDEQRRMLEYALGVSGTADLAASHEGE